MEHRLAKLKLAGDSVPVDTFDFVSLPDHLQRATAALGYTSPTPIQAQAIPLVTGGKDLAAEAQTGSGKTAAFALPLLQKLHAERPNGRGVRVLTLVPTRELAQQVAGAFRALDQFGSPPHKIVTIIGGVAIQGQITALAAGAAVVVATPGRLLDLLQRQAIDLTELHTLVLDEADKLLDVGFDDELSLLLDAVPAERQTLIFSATLPPKVLRLCDRVLTDPNTLSIDGRQTPAELVVQRIF
ncbi:MAG: ATP-dependent RNA helicase RhlE, partial [Myxococcota bacterium]